MEIPLQIHQSNSAFKDDVSQYYIDPGQSVHSANDSLRRRASTSRKYSVDLMRQLPSRHIDDTTVDRKSSTFHRRNSHYATLRLRNATNTSGATAADADRVFELLTSDESASPEKIKETLREMLQTLTLKRIVKARLIIEEEKKKHRRQLSLWKKKQYRLLMGWEQMKYGMKELIVSIELWYSHLKTIQGHFGSGVASYFIFLRWLFLLNLSISFILVCFIIVPQALWWHAEQNSTKTNMTETKFSGSELITGAGIFTDSAMFYGHYTNTTIKIYKGFHYRMPHAYLFVNGIVFFICFILLSYSVAKAYRLNYIEASGELKNVFSNKVFCAWDYSIETINAARLKSKSIYNELKELLSSGQTAEKDEDCGTKLFRVVFLILVNAFVLSIMVGISYLVYYFLKDKSLKSDIAVLNEMTLSLVVTVVIFIIPMLFTYVAEVEWYYTKQTRLYITMIRVVLLKIVTLGVLVYFWLIAKDTLEDTKCWETHLGQEIYRLFIVDFLFILVFSTLFMEIIRCFMHNFCCKTLAGPEFAIAHNTLNVIYLQTLTWVGTFYSPLAPFKMAIALFILFYIKRVTVVVGCSPSQKPWRAAHMQTLFLSLTFINFLLAAFATGYSILIIRPSPHCGPFQTLPNSYEIVLNLLDDEKGRAWWNTITGYIFSPGVVAGVLIFMCVVVYYLRARAVARHDMVKLIREQLIMEGKDKVFLLHLFDKAMEQKTSRNGSSSDENSSDSKQSTHKLQQKSPKSLPREQVNQIYRDYSRHVPGKKLPGSQNVCHTGYDPGYLRAEVPANEGSSTGGGDETFVHANYKPGWGKQRQISQECEEGLPNKQLHQYASTSQIDRSKNLKQYCTRSESPVNRTALHENPNRTSGDPLPHFVHHGGFQHLMRDDSS